VKLAGEGHDWPGRKPIFVQEYRGPLTQWRQLAHRFADDVVMQFTGEPGVAGTRIAFIVAEGRNKELWVMDADGANAHAVDQPIAGLLADLKSRGLLDSTLVVWGGEFGRTPMNEGRDLSWLKNYPTMTSIFAYNCAFDFFGAYDVDANVEKRDAQGHCRECGVDEPGELLGEILDDPGKPAAKFDGYCDPAATRAEILRDVFKPGDAWFRTGDLLKRDARGYYYFVDRIGDTFRWKGENVSTTEVAETISAFPGVLEATVYGVAVPGHDGRAGMAAVVVDNVADFDLAGLRAALAERLPGDPCSATS